MLPQQFIALNVIIILTQGKGYDNKAETIIVFPKATYSHKERVMIIKLKPS